MQTIEQMRADDDWRDALLAVNPPEWVIGQSGPIDPLNFDNVEQVVASSEGENDGQPWIALFKLKNGTFAFLSAWCDYTGWD